MLTRIVLLHPCRIGSVSAAAPLSFLFRPSVAIHGSGSFPLAETCTALQSGTNLPTNGVGTSAWKATRTENNSGHSAMWCAGGRAGGSPGGRRRWRCSGQIVTIAGLEKCAHVRTSRDRDLGETAAWSQLHVRNRESVAAKACTLKRKYARSRTTQSPTSAFRPSKKGLRALYSFSNESVCVR